MKPLLLAILLTLSLNAQNLVDRIARIESNGNSQAIGDNGRSLGAFQMSESSWAEVNAVRKSKGLPLYQWKTGAHDPFVARQYAEAYLSILRNRLTRALKRNPTDAEIYASYCRGIRGFSRAGFNLNNCPQWLQRKAKTL